MNSLGNITRGAKTSEFWAVIIPVILGVLSHLGLHVTSDTIVAVAEGAAAVYAVVRTILKATHIKAVAGLNLNNALAAADAYTKAIEQAAIQDGAKTNAAATETAPVASEAVVTDQQGRTIPTA